MRSSAPPLVSSPALPIAPILGLTLSLLTTGCGDGGGTQTGMDAAQMDAADDTPTGGPCDIIKGTGCLGGTSCSLSPANKVVCDSNAGKTQTQGDTCDRNSTSDTCKNGLFCATVDMTEAIGLRCFKQCMVHADCKNGEKCQTLVYHLGMSFLACTDRCSAWSTNTCQSGQACTWTAADGAVCKSAGSKKTGDACTAVNDCVSGDVCYMGKCTQTCYKMAGSMCAAPATTCATGTCQQPSGSDIAKEDPCLALCL